MQVFNSVSLTLVLCAFGCGTMTGTGKHMEKGGQTVENATRIDGNAKRLRGSRQHAIRASAESGGTINPPGRTSVPHGASQTYIITANAGYWVTDVMVDGRSVGAAPDLYHDDSSSYTFNNVTASHVISALFGANSSEDNVEDDTQDVWAEIPVFLLASARLNPISGAESLLWN